MTQKTKLALLPILTLGVLPIVLVVLNAPFIWVLLPFGIYSLVGLVGLWGRLIISGLTAKISKQVEQSMDTNEEEYDNELTEIPEIGD